MEKQTIGQFLSALRRSNGFTQQEVAEKLGVSNKTVSCWERDSYSPDISVIPAIAELYGVTCDEILRAKRAPAKPAQEHDSEKDEEKARANAEKAEKEASAIFDNMLAKYENTQKIAVLSTVFATIAAICAAVLTHALTRRTIAVYGIAVPVAVLSFFILYLIQYRLDFAILVGEKTLAARKRMYRRKTKAFAFFIAAAAMCSPFCIDFDYPSRCLIAGIALAAFSLMIFYAVCLSRKKHHPDLYPGCDKSFSNKEAKVYTSILVVAILVTTAFGIFMKILPYGSYNDYVVTYDHTFEADAKSLAATLSIRSLPPEYEEVSSRVSYNYAEYEYSVRKKDFDKRDLEGYYFYTVDSDLLKDVCTVRIFYPVWQLPVISENAEGEKATSYESVTVFNRDYALSHITADGDGYLVTVLRYYDYEANKRSRDFEYTIVCAAAAVVFVFIAFGTWKEIYREKRKKIQASPPEND